MEEDEVKSEELLVGDNSILVGDLSCSWNISSSSYTHITLQQNSIGRITVDPNYAIPACLERIIDKHFEKRSYQFREDLKNVFKSKTVDQQLDCLSNTFTSQSLEFFENMEDSEIIRFITLTC